MEKVVLILGSFGIGYFLGVGVCEKRFAENMDKAVFDHVAADGTVSRDMIGSVCLEYCNHNEIDNQPKTLP